MSPDPNASVEPPTASHDKAGPATGRFKILITGMFLPHTDVEIQELADIADVVVNLEPSRAELFELVRDVDAIMLDTTPVDAELLDHAPRLKAVIMYGVGTDQIDGVAAAERGVIVSNSPRAFSTDVAEQAIALLFSLTRQIGPANDDIRNRRHWDTYGPTYFPIRLRGKTLGLVGLGRIGRETARIASGIGMHVIAYDPYLDPDRFTSPADSDIRLCADLPGLLAQSDAVSLHLPLTDGTRRLIGAEELAQMKPGSYLINVSRGPLIDQPALRAALESGHLAGAGLDVLDPEPPDWDDPLLKSRNLVLTPHLGWKSDFSLMEVEMDADAEVRRILLGQAPEFQVNG